jgi:nucleoside-diphosphate-sugar epimerase
VPHRREQLARAGHLPQQHAQHLLPAGGYARGRRAAHGVRLQQLRSRPLRARQRAFRPRYPADRRAAPQPCGDEYGLSKLLNEQTLDAFARGHGIESYALRLGWCWGPDEYRWRFEKPFDPANHAGGFWCYVDMRDVAQAFRKALHAPPMGQPACVTAYINAADTMADEPSAELVARFYPSLAGQARTLQGHESIFSLRAAREAFGYEPQYSWRA